MSDRSDGNSKIENKNLVGEHLSEDKSERRSSLSLLELVASAVKEGVVKGHFSAGKHKSIVKQALDKSGLSDAAIFAIEVGDLAQDLDSSTRGIAAHHFDDDGLAKGVDTLDEYKQSISKMLSRPDLTENDEARILYLLGQRLHTLQDFYAHSNYAELKLKDNPGLKPQEIPLMNFADIRDGQAGQVRTGFYYFQDNLHNEAVQFYLSRTGVINKLEQLHEKIPGTTFLPSADYKKLDSFGDRVNYVTDPRYSVLHADLSKDKENTDEGKSVNPETGINLHDYSQNLAVRETRKEWSHFVDEVHKLHGQDGSDKILQQMKNISFSNSVLRSLRYSVDGIITWLS